MGAKGSKDGSSRSLRGGHQAVEGGETRRFSTFRRTSEDARTQVEATLRGGLNRDLLDFLWMQSGGRAAKTQEAVHDVIKAVVRDYPALFLQAVELSFRAYEKAPGALPSRSTQRRMCDELQPVLDHMRAQLDAMGGRARHSLVKSAVTRCVSGDLRKRPRVPFEDFAASFEARTGPWLAARLTKHEFRKDLLDSLALRAGNALAPRATAVSGAQRPVSPREKHELDAEKEAAAVGNQKGTPYFRRAFSFRRRGGSPRMEKAGLPDFGLDDGESDRPREGDRRHRSGSGRGERAPARRKHRRSGSVQEH